MSIARAARRRPGRVEPYATGWVVVSASACARSASGDPLAASETPFSTFEPEPPRAAT